MDQRGVSVVVGPENVAGGVVYGVGFADAVRRCAIHIAVVDTSPSNQYTGIPTGHATARLLPDNSYPAYLPNVDAAFNVRVVDGGTGVARPFQISALC